MHPRFNFFKKARFSITFNIDFFFSNDKLLSYISTRISYLPSQLNFDQIFNYWEYALVKKNLNY